jgi:hypothetical protein
MVKDGIISIPKENYYGKKKYGLMRLADSIKDLQKLHIFILNIG